MNFSAIVSLPRDTVNYPTSIGSHWPSGSLNGSAIADRSTCLSPTPLHRHSNHAYFNLTFHIHIQADTMVSLNLSFGHPQYDTASGRPATQEERNADTANVFEYAYRHLSDYRNISQVYYVRAYEKQNPEIDSWANDLLKMLWTATTTRDPGWHKDPRIRSRFRLNRSDLTNQIFQNNVRGSNTISTQRHLPRHSRTSQN